MSTSTVIFECNVSVVTNSTNHGITLQYKSMSLSHNFVRENMRGDVVEVRRIGFEENTFDTLTKGLDSSIFNNCTMLEMRNWRMTLLSQGSCKSMALTKVITIKNIMLQ